MTQELHHAFGREIVAQRHAEFEAAARHGALIRRLKEGRRQARREEPAARPRSPQPARACCTADLG